MNVMDRCRVDCRVPFGPFVGLELCEALRICDLSYPFSEVVRLGDQHTVRLGRGTTNPA